VSLVLRDYQQPHFARLLTYLIQYGFAHDGSDTGTGKMYVGAALVQALGLEGLVICPLSIVPAWEETLNGFGAVNTTVMNYESAWRKLGAKKVWGSGSYFEFHRKYPIIVFDEAHRTGGETTISSKMLIAAKRAGSMILTQSATIAETPLRMKAFGFAAGLHKLNDQQDGWIRFLLRHQCKPGTFGGWTFSAKTHPEILPQIQEEIYCCQRGSRLRKKDIPNFPKMTTEVRFLGNPDKQLVRLGEELLAYYNERSVRAGTFAQRADAKHEAAVKAAEALGIDPPERGPSGEELARMMMIRQQLETAKVPLIIDMIEDAMEDSKIAVFCNFNETIEALIKAASLRKWKHGVIRGVRKGSGDGVREETKKAFQRNELDVVFVNIEAGGVGLSLHDPVTQVPRTQIICPTFSGTALKQVLGRSTRLEGGFCRNIMVYFEGTFESVIARIVRGKLDNLDLLNDAELSGDFRKSAK
jgi:hypothetical protein